jgi:dephospho-CoA kinase
VRLGLTGGIGSGKSTVAALLGGFGAQVIDADAQARALTGTGGAAIPALISAYGPGVLDGQGALDRAAMRERVFADPAQRARLEALLHPFIFARCLALAQEAGPQATVVLDLPLLVEVPGLRRQLGIERVLVVDCPAHLQRSRAAARSGLAGESVDAIMAAQARREVRLAAADDILVNAGTPAELESAVRRLWKAWEHAALC